VEEFRHPLLSSSRTRITWVPDVCREKISVT